MKIVLAFYSATSLNTHLTDVNKKGNIDRYLKGFTSWLKLSSQYDLVQVSDSEMSLFNRALFHYYLVNSYKGGVKKCIIKFYTKQRNKIYDMTNYLKTIITIRGGRYFLQGLVVISRTPIYITKSNHFCQSFFFCFFTKLMIHAYKHWQRIDTLLHAWSFWSDADISNLLFNMFVNCM